MNLQFLIPKWLRRLATEPTDQLSRWQLRVRYWIDLSRHCAEELVHDRATQMAAALTYHTLFSLLPTIVLAMVVIKAFVGEAEREQFKETVVEFVLPATVGQPADDQDASADAEDTQTAAPPDVGYPLGGQADDTDAAEPDEVVVAAREAEFHKAREDLANRIESLMDSLENINFGGIGTVGLLVFVYGATALLTTTEHSFNTIYSVSQARPWYVRFPYYFTVIVLGPVVLIVGQIAQERMINLITDVPWTAWLAGPALVVLPVISAWLVLFLMYVLLPNTTVSKRTAAAGSFVAALLGALAKELFRLYVGTAAITSFYGAMALLPLFLLWLYLMWLVVLFGLELTYTLQAMKGRRFKHEAHRPDAVTLFDPAWLIPFMGYVAEAFERGKSCSLETLVQKMRLPHRVVTRVVQELIRSQLVHQVQQGEEHAGAITLARPAEQIRTSDVIAAGERLMPSLNVRSAEGSAWSFVRELAERRQASTEQTTLAEALRTGSSQ